MKKNEKVFQTNEAALKLKSKLEKKERKTRAWKIYKFQDECRR